MLTPDIPKKCDSCGNKLEDDKPYLSKACSTCKSARCIHEKCATKFFTWKRNVGKEEFTVDKFLAKQFKFFCIHCLFLTCPFCSKKHNVGEPNAFPVECSASHWCIIHEQCSPSKKFSGATKNNSWYCPLHQTTSNSMIIANDSMKSSKKSQSLSSILLTTAPNTAPVKKWFYDKDMSLDFYQLRQESFTKFTTVNLETLITQLSILFRTFMDQCLQPFENRITKTKQERNDLNRLFIKTIGKVYPTLRIDGERKTQEHQNLLHAEINFPSEVTRAFLESIVTYSSNGGYLCDISHSIFNAFLQEISLQQFQFTDHKLKHLFLNSYSEFYMYPEDHTCKNTNIFEIFGENYLEDLDKQKLFEFEYRTWFEHAPKHCYDAIFEELNNLNEFPQTIEFPYCIERTHWIVIRCYFPCVEYPHGYVYSIDHDSLTDDNEMVITRAKFSKLLGVYYDLRTGNYPYCGPLDIIHSCNMGDEEYLEMKEKENFSVFPHSHEENCGGRQQDKFNCGVICFKSSINLLRGQRSMMQNKEISQKNCNEVRRNWFAFLRKFVETIYPGWTSKTSSLLTPNVLTNIENYDSDDFDNITKEEARKIIHHKKEVRKCDDDDISEDNVDETVVETNNDKEEERNDFIMNEVTLKSNGFNTLTFSKKTKKVSSTLGQSSLMPYHNRSIEKGEEANPSKKVGMKIGNIDDPYISEDNVVGNVVLSKKNKIHKEISPEVNDCRTPEEMANKGLTKMAVEKADGGEKFNANGTEVNRKKLSKKDLENDGEYQKKSDTSNNDEDSNQDTSEVRKVRTKPTINELEKEVTNGDREAVRTETDKKMCEEISPSNEKDVEHRSMIDNITNNTQSQNDYRHNTEKETDGEKCLLPPVSNDNTHDENVSLLSGNKDDEQELTNDERAQKRNESEIDKNKEQSMNKYVEDGKTVTNVNDCVTTPAVLNDNGNEQNVALQSGNKEDEQEETNDECEQDSNESKIYNKREQSMNNDVKDGKTYTNVNDSVTTTGVEKLTKAQHHVTLNENEQLDVESTSGDDKEKNRVQEEDSLGENDAEVEVNGKAKTAVTKRDINVSGFSDGNTTTLSPRMSAHNTNEDNEDISDASLSVSLSDCTDDSQKQGSAVEATVLVAGNSKYNGGTKVANVNLPDASDESTTKASEGERNLRDRKVCGIFEKEDKKEMVIRQGTRTITMSVVTQLSWLFGEGFYLRNTTNSDDRELEREHFVQKMKTYDTVFMSDLFRRHAPTSETINDEGNGEDTRRIVSGAIYEIVTFTQRQYKYKRYLNEKRQIVSERQVTGYKPTSKAIILHNISTAFYFRKFGYARCLLERICNVFKDNATYIYCVLTQEEIGFFPSGNPGLEKSEQFLKDMGFQKDPKNENFNLTLVNEKNNTEKAFSSEENVIYRCSTTHIRSMDNESKMYKTAKYLELHKNMIKRIIFTDEINEDEDLDMYMQKFEKKKSYVVKKSVKDKFSIPELIGKRKRKEVDRYIPALREKKKDMKHKINEKEDAMTDVGEEEDDIDTSTYKYYGFNIHFGWRRVEEVEVETTLLERAQDNPDRILFIPTGDRPSQQAPTTVHEEISMLPIIKRSFHVGSRTALNYGACQWMAAAMLIDLENEHESRKMIKYMEVDPSRVTWKFMYTGEESLSNILPKVTSYRVMRVKSKSQPKKQFLMNCHRGKFVVVLLDNNYNERHVVGIDCDSDPRMIWDCAERQALTLTLENLNRCTGEGTICIGIKVAGQIAKKLISKKKFS